MFEGLYFEFPKLGFFFFIFVACETLCRMRLPSLYFPHTASFARESVSASRLLWLLKWFGISMLVIAIMSPVKDTQLEVKPDFGYDIALVIDASQSMSAGGFDPANPQRRRFDVVQGIVKDFIAKRGNDNLGIVVFGKYSFVASPLTYDKQILARVVDQLFIGMAGKFTALYEALGQSVNLLSHASAKNRIAILLTDGHNTPGGKIPLEVATDLAKKEGIRVYTVGIGAPNEYNGALLEFIAQETGGEAFGAQRADQLKAIYEQIDTLEKSKIERQSYTYMKYYYLYPLFLGLLSLLLYVYMRNKRGWA